MLVRCTIEFRDLKTPGKPMRRVGDEWDATPERLYELRRSRYGILAEAVEDKPAEAARAPHGAEAEPVGGAAPTMQELEEMTVRQLVELCIREGVETQGRPRKAELLASLKAFYGLE